MNAKPRRAERIPGVALAKAQVGRAANGRGSRRANAPRSGGKSGASAQGRSGNRTPAPSQLLTPKNMQDTLKTVGNLRNMVKNWLNYLQQADKMLDTFYVTTGALKESGVLDKLLKFKGRNLTTEDFTNILAALLSSPLAENFFKGSGDRAEASGQASEAQGSAQAPQTGPAPQPSAPQQPPQPAPQAQGPVYAPPTYAPYAAPAQPYVSPPMYAAPPPYPYGYGPPPSPVPPPPRPAPQADGGRASN